MKDLSDTILIKEYQKGNKKAFPILVERWHVKFCKLAYWYVKDADVSKDIAQECWTLIIDKLLDLKDPDKFKSWATSIVNRKTIDWLRAKKRLENNRNKYKIEKNVRDEEVIEEKEYVSEVNTLLNEEIAKLSDKQKIIIKLFYIEEYSLKEIAEFLNITIGTAKSRLFYTREKLKTKFKNSKYGK